MVKLAGDAESAKVPVGFTLSATVAVCEILPDVPSTVTVVDTMGAVALAVSVSVLVVPVVGFGENDAVTALGNPKTEKLTFPVNPVSSVIVMVLVPLVPCKMAKPAGDADREKFGPFDGQLFTRFVALTVPIPVAKSHPGAAA